MLTLRSLHIQVTVDQPNTSHTAPAHSSSCGILSSEVLPCVLLADRLREVLLVDHLAELLEVRATTVVPLCEMYRLILR